MKYVLYCLAVFPLLMYAEDSYRARKPKLQEVWCPRGHFNLDQAGFVAELANVLKPMYVLETGFCTGRSAVSVLTACSPKKFVSIDINLDYIQPEGRQMAALLSEKFTCFTIIEGNSRTILMQEFMKGAFPKGVDWATIDGDHSYEGCLLDLRVSKYLNERGIIIIDDYKSGPPNGYTIPDVTNAVEDFCKQCPDFYKVTWNKKGKGFAVLTRSQHVYELVVKVVEENMKP